MAGQVESEIVIANQLPDDGEWYLLHTRPRQEKLLDADLEAMGIGRFLPLIEKVQFRGKQKTSAFLPLYSGYVFLRGTRDQAFEADRTKRVARIIEVSDQIGLQWELENLHLALERKAELDPYPYLREGTRVEVRSGPFEGLQGVIERKKNASRLILQIDMLGRAMSFEVESALLEPMD